MFGADDDQQQSNDDPAMLDNVKQLASEPADQVEPIPTPSAAPAEPTAATAVAEPAQGFSTPVPAPEPDTSSTGQPDPAPQTTDLTPAEPPAMAAAPTQPADDTQDEPAADASPATGADPTHLAGLKQEALDHLEPLADHIDGSPEETFKTTMMMIQANDNHTLLEKALTAAKKIEDDKVRAQAMLDIINEINYFAQNGADQ